MTKQTAKRSGSDAVTMPAAPVLRGEQLCVSYGEHRVIEKLDVTIPPGEFTVIVGPNACGKSTLLRTLTRLLQPTSGQVTLGERPLAEFGAKELARHISLLPQNPIAPDDIVVRDLVSRGRYPYQGLFRQRSAEDEMLIDAALNRAGITHLEQRKVAQLSGGQRQRVWIALVLAQNTDIVFLDEPTTFLDITHQVEVLTMATELQQQGKTVVAVLHDLSLAFRYATHLIMMRDGSIVAEGNVRDIVTPQLLQQVYDLECDLLVDPRTDRPVVIPR